MEFPGRVMGFRYISTHEQKEEAALTAEGSGSLPSTRPASNAAEAGGAGWVMQVNVKRGRSSRPLAAEVPSTSER
jgi:hypothetical protein